MRFLRHLPRTLLAFALILAVSGSASAVETALLTVISFNVESDADTNPALVADDIAAIGGDV
ncbi:MAG TPA: hypothetical protein VKA18_09345, partial [Alphaproteobacteria bacterium]|nr:hypothetical protein [Alphaproteobacteria bacterium]